MLTTYQDMVSRLRDFLGGNTDATVSRDVKRVIAQAIKDWPGLHRWSWYWSKAAMFLRATYDTGTVAYDHTGGTYERMVTLTSGTWPTWAAEGTVAIDDVRYRVATRESGTVITLHADQNPGADVSSGTDYTLMQDTYTLPADFSGSLTPLVPSSRNFHYLPPSRWHRSSRLNGQSGTPTRYTMFQSPDYPDRLALAVEPYPTSAETLDCLYQRKPREPRTEKESTGTITVSSGATSVAGSGTVFTQAHVGCVLRLGTATTEPTGNEGSSPYAEELIVRKVTSTTALELYSAAASAHTAVKYTLSDPIDVRPNAMESAFIRYCESILATARHMRERADLAVYFQAALQRAKESDRTDMPANGIIDYPAWVLIGRASNEETTP